MMMQFCMFLFLLFQFGTAAPPVPPSQPVAPTQTPFGTAAPPAQPPVPVVTPFGTIPGAPTPVISNEVALFIGTLIYGADARFQVTGSDAGLVYCLGKQQYYPSAIVTFLGTLDNLPQAGKPSSVNWTCAPSWAQVLAQLIGK